ncbi:hypothetical protein LSH36_2172g00025, partial [Paralvinella palmiformis]
NWYNGETYCSQNDIQGDIAYSYLDDDTLMNDIINFVNDSKVCVQLLFGVRKRTWFWIAGKKRITSNEESKYVNEYLRHPSTSNEENNDDPEYIVLEPINHQMDMINSHVFVGTKNTKNDVQYKQVLYDKLWKLKAKTDTDMNKKKGEIDPEELYTKLQIPRDEKTKMEKVSEENQTTTSLQKIEYREAAWSIDELLK